MTMTAQEKKEFALDCIKALTQMVKENQTDNPEFYYSTMQHCEATAKDYETVCVSSHVTQAESDELDRIYNNPPVVDGELVLIDGEVYKTRLIKGGDYSNTAIFDKVEA